MFQLFSLLTLDNWSDIYNDILGKAPTIALYLVSYIVIETFIFVQLFVAVIVNNLQELQRHNKEKMSQYLVRVSSADLY